jgi:hypothetical protein
VDKKSGNGFAITALVLGIVGFILGWTGILGLVLAVLGLVFSILALVKKQNKGMAVTGVVLSSLALVAALIFTMIGAAFLGGAAKVASDVHTAQQEVDHAKKDFAVGETGVFGNLNVKVAAATHDWKATDGYSTPSDGNEYVFVSLHVENKGSNTVSVNPFYFKMNDQGVVVDHEIATTPTPFNAVDLKAGASIDGDLVYQVKQGAKDLKLEYKTYDSKALKDVTYSIKIQ